ADIAQPGSLSISVFNPSPGGGLSAPVTLTVTTGNPVPSLLNISPASVIAGTGALNLTVNGSNSTFLGSSIVRVNGSNRPTTLVNSNQLTALIPATDVAVAGSLSITVFNPAPGGGTSSAATLSVLGSSGFSLQLNGTSSYVAVSNSLSLNITNSITVEAWFQTSVSKTKQSIVERYNATSTNSDGGYALRLQSNGKLRFLTLTNGSVFSAVDGLTTPVTGVWHHVAGVFDQTTGQLRLYLDGKLDGSFNGAIPPGTGSQSLTIGRGADGTGFFNGKLDEIRITAGVVYSANFTPPVHLPVNGAR